MGASDEAGQVAVGQVYLRLASRRDVPHIRQLIEGLARFEKLEHACVATDEALEASLFDSCPGQAPFKSTTVVMLEVGSGAQAAQAEGEGEGEEEAAGAGAAAFSEVLQFEPRGELGSGATAVADDEKHLFVSTCNSHRTVVAFALVFPNYSTFLARPGLYLEDLFVREPYRRLGLGTVLLRCLARAAHTLGMGRLDWSVLDWNEKAITFYTQRMGATLMSEWRICRLEGETLEAAAKAPKL